MERQALTISVPLEAELLLRFKGSDVLHSLGVVTYEPDIQVVLEGAVSYQRAT